MAQLTWRNVDAPDVGTSLRGLDQFSRLLNQAVDTARGTAAQIDNERSAEVNQGIALAALREQDPAAFQRRLQEGTFLSGVDPRRVSAQTISMLASRPGQLMTQALTGQQLQAATRTNEQTVNNDALAGDVARLDALRRAGKDDPALAASIDARRAGIGAGNSRQITSDLGAADRAFMDETTQTLRNRIAVDENARGWSQDRRSNNADARDGAAANRAAVTFEQQQEDRRNEIQASQLIDGIITAGVDPRGIASLIQQQPAALRPALFRQAGAMGYSNLLQTANSAEGGPTGAGYGQSYDSFRVALESGGNPNAQNPRSSAAGRDQFTADTWFRVLRQADPGWAKGMSRAQLLQARFDPAKSAQMERYLQNQNAGILRNAGQEASNENLYAMHHFGARRGGRFVAASGNTPIEQILKPEQIADNPYLKGMTKAQVLANWAGRAGQTPAASQYVTDTAKAGVQQRNAQDLNDPVLAAYSEGLTKPGIAANQVGQGLSAGRLKGIPSSYIENRIREYQSQLPGWNDSQIGALIARHIVPDNRAEWTTLFPGAETRLGGKRVLDRAALDADVARAKTGDLTGRLQVIAGRNSNVGSLDTAQAAATQANTALAALRGRIASGQYVAPEVLRRYEAAAEDANRRARALQDNANNADNRPR